MDNSGSFQVANASRLQLNQTGALTHDTSAVWKTFSEYNAMAASSGLNTIGVANSAVVRQAGKQLKGKGIEVIIRVEHDGKVIVHQSINEPVLREELLKEQRTRVQNDRYITEDRRSRIIEKFNNEDREVANAMQTIMSTIDDFGCIIPEQAVAKIAESSGCDMPFVGAKLIAAAAQSFASSILEQCAEIVQMKQDVSKSRSPSLHLSYADLRQAMSLLGLDILKPNYFSDPLTSNDAISGPRKKRALEAIPLAEANEASSKIQSAKQPASYITAESSTTQRFDEPALKRRMLSKTILEV